MLFFSGALRAPAIFWRGLLINSVSLSIFRRGLLKEGGILINNTPVVNYKSQATLEKQVLD